MDSLLINSQSEEAFRGRFVVPGDKSIEQRALVMASMAEGTSYMEGVSPALDCASMIQVLRQLGADIKSCGTDTLSVCGWGAVGPRTDVDEPLDCGNSGTCMRLVAGLLAVGSGVYTLVGDSGLSQRSMRDLADVLAMFGAKVEFLGADGCAPIRITGSRWKDPNKSEPTSVTTEWESIKIDLTTSSAQLKTSAMLASLARGNVRLVLTEPFKSRDHSELLFRSLGLNVIERDLPNGLHRVVLNVKTNNVQSFKYKLYGDSSSAAFLIALAVLKPHSHMVVDSLCINPTRMGFFMALKRMNATICARYTNKYRGEMIGGITADYSHLRGVEIAPSEVPLCLDEIPLLAVVASRARGITKVRGAAQLRTKECDRISDTLHELAKLGVKYEEYPDGFDIMGLSPDAKSSEYPASSEAPIHLDAHGDHRLAMSLGVAACICRCPVELTGAGLVGISFPNFWTILREARVLR
ncbi:MAG: 3-phosphoshikimate 1-carboxyvinyltransferase [bacterium]|nr:3-phosphoshikimate 1-carboxyvinyltransferase [bacterium]